MRERGRESENMGGRVGGRKRSETHKETQRETETELFGSCIFIVAHLN